MKSNQEEVKSDCNGLWGFALAAAITGGAVYVFHAIGKAQQSFSDKVAAKGSRLFQSKEEKNKSKVKEAVGNVAAGAEHVAKKTVETGKAAVSVTRDAVEDVSDALRHGR